MDGFLAQQENAIQICGFDLAYELFGCGVINGEDKLHKKDIQLLFQPREKDYEFDYRSNLECNSCSRTFPFRSSCLRCFNSKENCTCNELKVFKNIEEVEKFMEKREEFRLKKAVVDNL